MTAGRPCFHSQAGLSIIEMLVASFVGLLALLGILFLYKAQNKGVVVQGSVAEMRLNAQFTLNEMLYYLAPAGLGLPDEMKGIDTSKGDLIVNTNASRLSAPSSKDAAYATANKIKYNLTVAGDTVIFRKKVYAVLRDNNAALKELKILSVAPKAGAVAAFIILQGDKTLFPAGNTIYPLEKTRLHRNTGAGADTVAGYFRVISDNPFLRVPAVNLDSLSLAEGIDSLGYRYHPKTGAATNNFPANLEDLLAVEVIVRAKTLIKDVKIGGDGYRRQTVKAKVNYRRSF